MSDDNNREDEQQEPEVESWREILIWVWRWLSPICTLVYLMLVFDSPTPGTKLIAAFLTLLFAASTSLAWRVEIRTTQE